MKTLIKAFFLVFTLTLMSCNETDSFSNEEDYQNLKGLFDEIHELSTSVSCTDNNAWLFTPYGSKACGGPDAYIAYSNQIDTVAFLNLVSEYTQAQYLYNIKWGVISTCDITPEPTSVECQNGLPILIY